VVRATATARGAEGNNPRTRLEIASALTRFG